MKLIKKIIRYFLNRYRISLNYYAVRQLITPFTPYLICKYHLSNEIHKCRVEWINRQSKDLTKCASEVRDRDWLFCDVDLIPKFVHDVLPQIRNRFVLITGKWNLPGFEESKYTDELICSEKVILWFSQNMTINHPKCHPFPYGIHHESTREILREMRKPTIKRKNKIYFSYAHIHGHLTPATKAERMALRKDMDKRLSLPMYLRKLREHCYVTSPQGDRPATHRHWEAIALGCVPISQVPDAYKKLFGENMMFVNKMEDALQLNPDNLIYSCPDRRIVTVSYWIHKLKELEKRAMGKSHYG